MAGAAEILGFKKLAKEASQLERAVLAGSAEVPSLLSDFIQILEGR